jgi:3-oxoacyl-(acyl-carrier-protein) synthase
MRWIQYGDAKVVIAGGTEASISPLSVTAFSG